MKYHAKKELIWLQEITIVALRNPSPLLKFCPNCVRYGKFHIPHFHILQEKGSASISGTGEPTSARELGGRVSNP